MSSATEAEFSLPPSPDADVEAEAPVKAIEGRSLRSIAWRRLRKDKAGMAAGVMVIIICLLAIFAGPITSAIAHPPNFSDTSLLSLSTGLPKGKFGGVSFANHYWLGVDPTGRDVFSRILYGAQVSLAVSVVSTIVAVALGLILGAVAGYAGGLTDTGISRVMDIMLAFPVLQFAIALQLVIGNLNKPLLGLSQIQLKLASLVMVIGFFSWAYIGRIIRGQTLSLREKEFVEAARSLGAGPGHILFRQILPNLWGPVLVYSTLLIPTNILFEAALSFLGLGIPPPTPSWGGMLNDATQYYTVDPMYMIVPGLAIFITVIAFNIFGDSLRDALDPRSTR